MMRTAVIFTKCWSLGGWGLFFRPFRGRDGNGGRCQEGGGCKPPFLRHRDRGVQCARLMPEWIAVKRAVCPFARLTIGSGLNGRAPAARLAHVYTRLKRPDDWAFFGGGDDRE
jgi:hypothetical protein